MEDRFADRRRARLRAEKGIVHRDLKPANVKVTAEGVVKLLDAKPREARIDPDALSRLILAVRASTDLRVMACAVAERHQLIESVNALKDVADSQSKTRDNKKTLGQAARAALLALWPESTTWISSRLEQE